MLNTEYSIHPPQGLRVGQEKSGKYSIPYLSSSKRPVKAQAARYRAVYVGVRAGTQIAAASPACLGVVAAACAPCCAYGVAVSRSRPRRYTYKWLYAGGCNAATAAVAVFVIAGAI